MKFNETVKICEATKPKRSKKLKPTKPVQLSNGLWYKVDSDGCKWYARDRRFNILHRLDGPAMEEVDSEYSVWWVDGKHYCEDDFNKLFGKYKNVADRQVVADMEGMFE